MRLFMLFGGGVGCLVVGIIMSVVTGDLVLLAMSAILFVSFVAKGFLLKRKINAAQIYSISGVCVSSAPKMLGRYRRIELVDTTTGGEVIFVMPKKVVFKVGHVYTCYFDNYIQESETGTSQAGGQQNRVTTVTPFSDGTIGRITIPALNNRTAYVRPGLDLSTLDHYVGHFSYTSQWDGNIALASHNRGRGSFFAGIWTLQGGDRIFYETTLGVRAFEVISIEQISENDLGNLDHSQENILTLVTCVYSQPSLRWSVRAREVI